MEKWTWDAKTKIKNIGLFPGTKSFVHILTFVLACNGLEPLRPLIKKL